MEIVKQMTIKAKAIVALVVAGIVVGVIAFKKYVSDAFKNGDLEKAETELQEAADTKLKEEVEKIEAIKEAEIVKVEQEREIETAKLVEKEEESKKELTDLAKKDRIAFRDQANKKLGIKEKKTPGRKPRK